MQIERVLRLFEKRLLQELAMAWCSITMWQAVRR